MADRKARIATALRRLADRLAPAPAGDCGSGATWVNYSILVPPAGSSVMQVGSVSQNQVFTNSRFEDGPGEWEPT